MQTPPASQPASAHASRRQVTPLRAFGHFILAALYFFLARLLARHGAHGLVSQDWTPLVEQAMFAFLLLFGYAGMGFSLDRELSPISRQGLPFRSGWLGEASLGLATGWTIAVVCVLALVLFGGIAIHVSFNLATFGWLFADAAYFALATLAIEIAFRGYPFQCAIRAIGELPAALTLSVLYGILQAWQPGASRVSMFVNIALGLLLSLAYLRTRALWLPWGLHFGWVASRALLFGLPVKQISSHSPIIQGDPLSAFALSGGDYGLDGSWLAFAIILAAMPFLYRATRDLSFVHNAPVLEPGGIPVDLDAAAKRQHEAATRPEAPEPKPLVQILPAAYPASYSEPEPISSGLTSDPDSHSVPSREATTTHPVPEPD